MWRTLGRKPLTSEDSTGLVQLLVEVTLIDLEAGDIQRFSQREVAFLACLVAAARNPSTQSASSARSALFLAATRQRYLFGPADCAVKGGKEQVVWRGLLNPAAVISGS
jgi:hypothetical protein